MNYQRHYDLLITKAKSRILSEEVYMENHHIIPKCLGGSDNNENLVRLTPEEHFVAHLLLHKINPNHHGLLSAIVIMSTHNSDKRINNKLYGWVKRKFSESCKVRMRQNHPKGFLGKKHTKEAKQRISKTTKKSLAHLCVKVNQYSLDGKLIKIHDSITDASKCVSTSTSNIKYCCDGKFSQMCGYAWSYGEFVPVSAGAKGPKEIITPDGIFKSVKECMKYYEFSSSNQVRRRCLSDKYQGWGYLTGPNKIISKETK
jgi:hypothetical protein